VYGWPPPPQTKYNLSKPQLHNHYIIQVQYHPADDEHPDEFRVVGVIVYGLSRKYTLNDKKEVNCKATTEPLVLSWDHESAVTYTYDVRWTYSTVEWATRWDNYLHVYDPKIHWFRCATARRPRKLVHNHG